MDARLIELLERMTAPGPFPNMSCSEGHELVDLVYDMAKATRSQTPLGQVDLLVSLQWSLKKPENVGWYWCKREGTNSNLAAMVKCESWHELCDGYEWAGPLSPPE